jgi:outer membrane lipoprotein carrier protein
MIKKNTKTNHGYEPQSKFWKYFAASCRILYLPLSGIAPTAFGCGIIRLINTTTLRLSYWSLINSTDRYVTALRLKYLSFIHQLTKSAAYHLHNLSFTTPLCGIVQLTNPAAYHLHNLSFTNKQFTKIALAVVCFFAWTGLALAAEAPPLDDVVSRLQQTYEKTEDFKASFVQETTVKSIKKTEIEEGTVYFKNPKNMLWNYTKPKAKKLIINPQKAWLYLPGEKVVYTQASEQIFQSKVIIKFLSGLGKLTDDFTITYASPQALDKNGNLNLLLTPKEKVVNFNTMQITVDKKSFYILQVDFDDVLGNHTVLRFSNISNNTGLSPKLFQFQPPAGVSIFKMP